MPSTRPRLAVARILLPLVLSVAVCATGPVRAVFAQAPASDTSAPAVDTTLAVSQLRVDFDTLRHALEEAHGGFDRFASRADVGRRLARHRARLDHPMSRLEFAGVVAEAIAELRDGHARLELDSATAAALAGAHVLPLRVMFEKGRLMVLFNDTPADSTIRPGMEVVRINGRSVQDVVGMLLPKVAGDGFIKSGRFDRLAREFARDLWLYGGRSDTYLVEARDASGRVVTAILRGILDRERLTNANPVNAALASNLARMYGPPNSVALEFLDDSAVAVLRVHFFDGEDFPAHLESALRLVREKNLRSLILDLRGNGGGVDEYGALLLSYFTDKPFHYFDRIRVTTIAPSFATWLPRTFDELRAGTARDPSSAGFLVSPTLHPGVGEQQPARQPFLGRLVALIDGGSFSTTADVAAHLRSWKRATFVGDETGGGYEGNTSGLNALVVLPHSHLRTKVMMYGYWNAVRPPDHPGRGTLPDHFVTLHVAELLSGDDPVLTRAIALVR